MKKVVKILLKTLLILLILICLLFLVAYINHRANSAKEKDLLAPLGEIVEVDGHNMSVYKEGDGEKTLVFLSGGGTSSPILDFKSLYSLLSDEYQIVVVEKFGYGFSDIVKRDRDVETMVEDTRKALEKAGVTAPYVICPHSMSGLEAIYWANKYPDEISAIIGLDMAVPEYYDDMEINITNSKLLSFFAKTGITRFIPNIAESDAIKGGTLTDNEKEIYRAVFYSRTLTDTMVMEHEAVKENAEIAEKSGIPQIPTYLFVSNGTDTGFTTEKWRKPAENYVSKVENGRYMELDCSHYLHNYEYTTIAEEIREFLSE